ncbi:putative odorant receptor 71a [Scaptodrosophila lebanonensis]|uniref:Odorant receptor n=1 Tax=Drosophila lebanonensis TaxID=7225 RepID=A0A6J2UEZ0_DROLE|nr:putative odorant receptor 71a [Scaptodrosophila lebanonensis]
MSFDNIQASRILLRILSACGLWPEDTISRRWFSEYSHCYRYVLHFLLTFVYTSLMWVEVLLSTDFAHTIDVLFITLTETALCVKIYNNWRYAHKVQELLTEWSSSQQFELRSSDECKMWQREQRKFGLIIKGYIGCSEGVVPCLFLSVLVNFPNELPVWIWTPFDWHQPRMFWLVYAYTLLSLSFTCISNISLDMLNCYMMLHLSLCLRLLGLRLEKLQPADELHLREQFVENVSLHRRIKSQAQLVENYISNTTTIQILLSSIILCLSIYRMQLLNILEYPGIVAAMLQYCVSMTLQIYVPSFYGNEITYYSNQLTKAAYFSQWPPMSSKMRHLICVFMTYLNRPLKLRAGGFFDIGLPLFTKTMNQAYSLLALLLNLNNN